MMKIIKVEGEYYVNFDPDMDSVMMKIIKVEDEYYVNFDPDMDIEKDFERCFERYCRGNILEEDFIRKFKDKINWLAVIESQRLSEDFIEDHAEYIDLEDVLHFQNVSEDFIRRHAEKIMKSVSWYDVFQWRKLSKDFILDIVEFMNLEEIDDICFEFKNSGDIDFANSLLTAYKMLK